MNDKDKKDGRFLVRDDQGEKTIIGVRWILIIVIGYLIVFTNPYRSLLSPAYLLFLLFALSNFLLMFSPKRWFNKDSFIFFILLVDVGISSLAIYITARMDSELYLIYFLILFIAAITQKTKFIYFSTGLLMVSYGIFSYLRYPQSFSEPSFLLRFPFIFVVGFFFNLMIDSYNRVRREQELLQEDYRELEVLTEVAQSIGHNKKIADFLVKLNHSYEDNGEMPRGKETVLIVEDNKMVEKMARTILERQGYRVIRTNNSEEAVEIVSTRREPIDLLLTDMIMPGLNGTELYHRIAAIRLGLKVLYMSGYTDHMMAIQGIIAKGAFFIPKPFSVKALAMKVREVLDAAG